MLSDMQTCAEQKHAIEHPRIRNESLFLLWDRRHNWYNRNLAQCVDRYSKNECKDPRDKVYALRGILKSHESEMLLVDYKKYVLEVFLDAVRIIAHPPSDITSSPLAVGITTDQVRICLRLGSQMLPSDEMVVVRPFLESANQRSLYKDYDAWL